MGGGCKFAPPIVFFVVNSGKMIFLSPFFLTFSFYLFYAVCENFNTKGTILWKIRRVWSWEVSFFLYFLYKPRISHNLCLDNENYLQLSHKQDNNETNIFWNFRENMTAWRHITSLDVIWAHARFATCQIWRSINREIQFCPNIMCFFKNSMS